MAADDEMELVEEQHAPAAPSKGGVDAPSVPVVRSVGVDARHALYCTRRLETLDDGHAVMCKHSRAGAL